MRLAIRFRVNRRFGVVLLLGAAFTMSAPMLRGRLFEPESQSTAVGSEHDFDFLVGNWTVAHRRLKHALAHSTEWETFSGTCTTWRLLNGNADVDDNVLQAPAGVFRAITLRSFDPATKSWSIWWLDGRHPHDLAPPVAGEFRNGVGTFFARDTFEGRAITVRYVWSDITSKSAKWEQAFSEDGGKTWETNWVMQFHRVNSRAEGKKQ
jgi:hypothetical protein